VAGALFGFGKIDVTGIHVRNKSAMGFRDKVRRFFSTPLNKPRQEQEQVRNDIFNVLQTFGVRAQIAPPGLPEEEIGIGSSLLIDILEGPILWVNVREKTSSSGHGDVNYSYYTEYGVRDYRLGPELTRLRIHSVRIKTFPLIGKVIDLQWKGKDYGLGIIGHLSSDNSIKPLIMSSRDVKIYANSDYRCWILSTKTWHAPSEEIWNCYQAIARHLLAE